MHKWIHFDNPAFPRVRNFQQDFSLQSIRKIFQSNHQSVRNPSIGIKVRELSEPCWKRERPHICWNC